MAYTDFVLRKFLTVTISINKEIKKIVNLWFFWMQVFKKSYVAKYIRENTLYSLFS
jgi:hypothetical protein